MSFEACRTFLERWPEIAADDPEAGRAHAEEGMRRVNALGKPPELYARALAFLGSSLRTIDPDAAKKTLRRSLRIYRDEIYAPLDEADAYRRLAIVQSIDCVQEALDSVNIAYKMAQPLSPEIAARAQIERGRLWSLQEDFTKAFRMLVEAAPDLSGAYLTSTLKNLPMLIIYADRAGQVIPASLLGDGLELIRLARMTPSSRERWQDRPTSNYGSNPKCTSEDASARWAAGLLLEHKRRLKDAERILERVARDFIELQDSSRAVNVGIDLGAIYAKRGRWRKLARHARAILQIVRQGTPEAVAAFEQWQLAAAAQDMSRMRRTSHECRVDL